MFFSVREKNYEPHTRIHPKLMSDLITFNNVSIAAAVILAIVFGRRTISFVFGKIVHLLGLLAVFGLLCWGIQYWPFGEALVGTFYTAIEAMEKFFTIFTSDDGARLFPVLAIGTIGGFIGYHLPRRKSKKQKLAAEAAQGTGGSLDSTGSNMVGGGSDQGMIGGMMASKPVQTVGSAIGRAPGFIIIGGLIALLGFWFFGALPENTFSFLTTSMHGGIFTSFLVWITLYALCVLHEGGKFYKTLGGGLALSAVSLAFMVGSGALIGSAFDMPEHSKPVIQWLGGIVCAIVGLASFAGAIGALDDSKKTAA